MLENQSYSQIIGNTTGAPYQNTLATQCGLAQGYFAATHTSAANYFAISGGQYPANSPAGCGSVKQCANSENNLYNQLSGAGDSWDGFMESMPSNCDPTSGGSNSKAHDLYSVGHDPIVFYTDIPAATCQADDVAVPSLTATSGAFYTDLQNQTLPSFSVVIPNAVDDGEGPYGAAQNLSASDAWLQNFLGLIQTTPSYQTGNTLVLVTYDEGGRSEPDYAVGENCSNESADLPLVNGVSPQESCRVPTFVVYPYTPAGATDSTFFDHYSITKTVEDIFGLPYLANAGAAQTTSLVGHFGIPGTTSVPEPVVTISQPTGGSTVSGTVTVVGTATETTGTISQVQVSVDGGTPVTATGTTSWSTSINTAALNNGTHTITATATDAGGNTGTASESVTVDNPPATTSCPATPTGDTQLSGNVSVESNQAGWTGVYNSDSAVTRVEPADGSYDGLWALQVAPKSGDSGTAGLSNASPVWVTSTTAGTAYQGSVFVRASAPGEKVTLLLREESTGSATVGKQTATMTLNDTNWHQITVSYAAADTGDVLHYFAYASNLASSSQNFLADCLSLVTP